MSNRDAGPLISIIVATRNVAGTLARLLDSIASQTFQDYELIVIDGASTDGTQDILSRHESLVSDWISEPDNSIAEAWNKGLARTHGRWILFLGADDKLYHDDALLNMVPALESQSTDVVYGQLRYENGLFHDQIIGTADDIHRLKRTMSLPHPATFQSHQLFEEVGDYDPRFRIALDYELLLRKPNLTGYFVPNIVTLMNGADGSSSASPVASFVDAARAQRKHHSMSLMAINLRLAREILFSLYARLKQR